MSLKSKTVFVIDENECVRAVHIDIARAAATTYFYTYAEACKAVRDAEDLSKCE